MTIVLRSPSRTLLDRPQTRVGSVGVGAFNITPTKAFMLTVVGGVVSGTVAALVAHALHKGTRK